MDQYTQRTRRVGWMPPCGEQPLLFPGITGHDDIDLPARERVLPPLPAVMDLETVPQDLDGVIIPPVPEHLDAVVAQPTTELVIVPEARARGDGGREIGGKPSSIHLGPRADQRQH